MKESIIQRLLSGEHFFIPGGTNNGGGEEGDIGPWYMRVRAHGKFLHSTKTAGGVEMWADDIPPEPRARRPKRRYVGIG